MGRLVEGEWRDEWYDTDSNDGRFVREDASFRHWVTVDGSAGPTGDDGFAAAPGRYHLYVSLACPWAHRTLVLRALKGLGDVVDVSVVHPHMLEHGWELRDDFPGATGDGIGEADYLHQVYTAAKVDYTGRVTVPVLWDRERATIVNNESADILRMFNSAFAEHADDDAPLARHDFCPAGLCDAIDAVNAEVYRDVNNGVYKAGFATTQDAYDEAFEALFTCLDRLEERLGSQRWLLAEQLTEADIRLFTTLVRFDAVYVGHFKCNRRRIADYPNLQGYLRDLYQLPGVAATVDLAHIQQHYYHSHGTINPTGIVPRGPELDLDAHHGRDRAFG